MKMQNDTLKVKVFRFDPSVDKEAHYDEFEVPYNEHETILGVLHYIRENFDPGLTYRDSCAVGCCAICSVKVNGKAALACNVKMPAGDMVIDPVKKDKVLKDLATL
jgi:succinate dehydrogenase/fumarate reductase iron-sulfur protein